MLKMPTQRCKNFSSNKKKKSQTIFLFCRWSKIPTKLPDLPKMPTPQICGGCRLPPRPLRSCTSLHLVRAKIGEKGKISATLTFR